MPVPIPILNGIYTDQAGDFRTSYPVNLVPVPKDQGISKGYLRPGDGIIEEGIGPGIDRGAIDWNGTHYRVMGSKLVSIDNAGNVSILGDVGTNNKPVRMDYSFDRLGIASNRHLFYWKDNTLTQVTDSDLGVVIDLAWTGGYFMTTDGNNIIVTELNDPAAVNPLKYGSSEVNPDKIVAIWTIRTEVYAVNRYTIEVFANVGGSGFPFQRIEGSVITKGALSTTTACVFLDTIAFLGSGSQENESLSIYLGNNAQVAKIATAEVDELLQTYTEEQLKTVEIESRINKSHQFLYVHLPDRCIVYDALGSAAAKEPVWFYLTSTLGDFETYRARHFIWIYNKWFAGDPTTNKFGSLTQNISSHYGQDVRWEFGTTIVYNGGMGAIFHSLELVALTGRIALGKNPSIRTSYSIDGVKWSNERIIKAGMIGNTTKRLLWEPCGEMGQWRIQRFRGDSQAHLSFAKLMAELEPLRY